MAGQVVVLLEGTVTACRHGLWCDPCALPSAHEVDFAVTNVLDPTRILFRGTATICEECVRDIRRPRDPGH